MLTDAKLRALAKPNGNKHPIKVADRDGLCVVVTPKGSVTFTYRFRWLGKQQNVGLGKYPLMSLVEARQKHDECRRWVAEGKDPRSQLALARQANIEALTVGQMLDNWLSDTNRKDVNDLRRTFAKHIPKEFMRLTADDVGATTWKRLLKDVAEGKRHKPAPVAAGFLLQNIRLAMNYAKSERLMTSSALEHIEVKHVGKKQAERERVLDAKEIRDLLAWSDDIRHPFYYRAMVKLLLTFGSRTQEIRLSTVGEWDLLEKVWKCPVENSKNGEVITRPIPDEVMPLIQVLIDNAHQTGSELLLSESKPHTTVAGYGSCLPEKLGHEKWTFHDLRRTFASHLADDGADLTIIDVLLGHKLPKIQRIYNRSTLMTQKREVMDKWIGILRAVQNG